MAKFVPSIIMLILQSFLLYQIITIITESKKASYKKQVVSLFLYAEKQEWIGPEKMAWSINKMIEWVGSEELKFLFKKMPVEKFVTDAYEEFKKILEN